MAPRRNARNEGQVVVEETVDAKGRTRRRTTSPAPEQPKDFVDTGFKRDTLEMDRLRKISERVAIILGTDPEIQALFQKAWKGGYEGENGKARFWNDIENTNFWQQNSQDLREYVILSSDPNNADYKQKQEQAREQVRRTAMNNGLVVNESDLDELGEEYLMGGWAKPENEFKMLQRLSEYTGGEWAGGVYEKTVANLREIAAANGVDYGENWFDSAAKSVASKMTDEGFWMAKIRDQAAATYAPFADQIMGGMTVEAIANPYIKLMSKYWDVNPYEISLTDPTLLKGMTGYDAKGNPKPMNLGEFSQMLRNDPRWEQSTDGKNEITSTVGKVMQMFGLMGG